MKSIKLPEDKKVYLFEIDDILYQKRDYVLQIYYLFGQFVEYTEGRPIASEIVQFMKEQYEQGGENGLLEKTRVKFLLQQEYNENFERLQANGHLPLKLILFEQIKGLFTRLQKERKQFAILTKGNPIVQLNKLKHMDWEGWDRNIKIYFIDELQFRNIEPFAYIAHEFGVKEQDLFYIEYPLE